MTLEEKLIELRKQKAYTPRMAATKLEIDEHTLLGWEEGHSSPSLLDMKKISTLYDVPLDYLLDHEISLSERKRMEREGFLTKLKKLFSHKSN